MNWLHRARILLSRLGIKDRETHRMVHFLLKLNQEKLFAKMVEQWETEKKIRIIILKARRVGMSSLVDGLLWCYGLAFSNKNIKIVAHLAGSAEELFRVPSDLAKAFPSFLSEDIQMKRIFFPHAGGQSSITLATAGTPAAGRGGTLSALHLSEAAYFPSDASFTSMITSVSKGEGSIVIIESTANGREGPGEAFFEYWENSVAGKNGYIPVFLSWLDDPACVRAEEEAEDAPRDDLEKELMSAPYNASKEQIAWMRRTKADDCHDSETEWLTEYPHSANVAFQISGDPAFPREELAYAESTVKPFICRGKFVRTVGMRFEFKRDSMGPWHIWKFPFDAKGRSDQMKYYGGADAALGKEDGDFAAISILCGQTGELAARFAERIPPEALADQMDMAGRFYHNAMMNPELTGNLGRWALIKLRDVYRYPNIYAWKGRDDRKRGKSKSIALGFEMNQATRRLIVDAARSGLRMGMRDEPGGLIVNDRALMSQISLFTNKEWRWEVERGHDDILVSWLIACLTREQYPPMRMTFAPKNVMEGSDPKSRLPEGLPIVNVPPNAYEAETQFRNEMAMIRRQAGLRQDMRGTGTRHIDRLQGI